MLRPVWAPPTDPCPPYAPLCVPAPPPGRMSGTFSVVTFAALLSETAGARMKADTVERARRLEAHILKSALYRVSVRK